MKEEMKKDLYKIGEMLYNLVNANEDYLNYRASKKVCDAITKLAIAYTKVAETLSEEQK